jgi:sugar O-acyltransferase (sialic acid O-acetyltransferase NeuD family)
MKSIVIIGASGHGKVIADIAKNVGYEKITFLDDGRAGVLGAYEIAGDTSLIESFDADFFVAIGNGAVRKRIFEAVKKKGKKLPVLIHPAAIVAESVKIGEGTAVMAGAVINPDAVIGEGSIINTSASVDHDCVIGAFNHISVGSHIAGSVVTGENVWIGAGATVSNNITICSNVLMGAGAVAVKNITEEGTYIGVPARKK